MARLSITNLPNPKRQYRPDRAKPCLRTGHSFESFSEATAEELLRAKLIQAACNAPDGSFDRRDALELAKRLRSSGTGELEFKSMASKLYMGRMRHRIGGALWKLAKKYPDARTFTIAPRGWVFNADELQRLDPRLLINSLRSAINRAGAKNSGGFLILSIHGEFEPSSKLYYLHVHGFADARMLAVINRLRKKPKYRRRRSKGEKRTRVRLGRKALTNLPYPLTYIYQSSWPKRWRGEFDGVEYKGSKRHRIPEPFQTILLLWLDKWSLRDITLMMGISVGRNGFTIRNSKTYTNGIPN